MSIEALLLVKDQLEAQERRIGELERKLKDALEALRPLTTFHSTLADLRRDLAILNENKS